MMKKICAFLVAAIMVTTVVGCSASGVPQDAAADGIQSSEGAASEETESSAGAETDIKVSEDEIEAAASGGNVEKWEEEYVAEYEIAGDEKFTWGFIDMGYEDTFTTKIRNTFVSYCEKNFPNVEVLEADGELYLALRDGPRGFRRGFTCPAVLRILNRECDVSSTGLSPSMAQLPNCCDYVALW